MGKIREFFQGVKSEMKKVRWPGKKRMVQASFATIVVIVGFALFFFGLDFIIVWLKELI